MSKTSLRAGAAASAFAHLLGLQAPKPAAVAPTAASAEDDDEKKAARAKQRAEEDSRRSAEDERRREEDARRAEEDGEGDDDNDKNKDGKNGKRAKAAEDDEECAEERDDDEDMAAAARAGRTFERARCAAIFATPAAGIRPDVAAHLAFETGMSASAAVALLATTAAGPVKSGRRSIDDRMAVVTIPNPGPTGGEAPSAAAGLAAQIIAAGKKARGEA